ncbi:MAG: hypothetical protein ABUT39_18515 [Acidobacteriota bacterium]
MQAVIPDEPEERWSLARRFAVRFLLSYFLLLLLTYDHVLLFVPRSEPVVRKYVELWYPIVVWVGKSVLHLDQDIYLLKSEADGISNTAFGTVFFFCSVALAAVAAGIWAALDRRRDEGRLSAWLRYLLRFMLAVTLIHYGAIKLIPAQMTAPPPLSLLLPRVADLTRMQLLWIFTGTSPVYESLTGLAELTGGVLLLFRRTTLLGALICAADMAMVVTLNFCYDVHVKLLSLHLLAMALLLVAPDLRRLSDLFFFDRRVERRAEPALFTRRRLDRAAQAVLLLFGLASMALGLSSAWKIYQMFHPPKPPLYGLWTVEEFRAEAGPPPWRTVMVFRSGAVRVERTDGSWTTLPAEVKDQARRIRFEAGSFSFSAPEADDVVLNGVWNGRPARVRLRRMELTRRSFHWFVDLREGDEEALKEK